MGKIVGNTIAIFTTLSLRLLPALALILRLCSGVNTRLPSEASAKDGLKGVFERSKKSFNRFRTSAGDGISVCGSVLFLSVCVTNLDARISMEIRTESGAHNQVIVGQPFTLDVTIDDVHGSVQAPTIKGLDNFIAKRTGMYMSSINGKSTTRYSYQVRIDAIGSYIIGPAVVMHQQQEHTSNQLRVSVVKDLGVAAQANKSNATSESKAFLRLMMDPESVVVGQKIGCTLRFYYQDQSISLHNIGMPELSGFNITEVSKLQTGIAEIDGTQYRYAQWHWDMYPTKPGEFIIPAYNADYDIPVKDNNHLLGGLFMFINNRVDRKRVYSNAATVKVLSLPHYDGHVHAVGSFERISAEIKPGVVKEGEGMVLVIDIEGVGNLHAIETLRLNMPDALKYYDSNSSVIAPQHTDELPKKRFEFIVQGMRCGDCEIPEQLFTYFDVEKNDYVTLRTCPLSVSIIPGSIGAKKDVTSFSAAQTQQVVDQDQDQYVADINAVGQWYPIEERQPLQWWLMCMLVVMPLFYVHYPLMREKIIVLSGNSARVMRRRAFKQARKKIELCIKNNDSRNLYAIFMELFQQLGYVGDGQIVLNQLLLGGPQSECNRDWGYNDFFERMTHAAYAHGDDKNTEQLCRMAKQWLERLEKIT